MRKRPFLIIFSGILGLFLFLFIIDSALAALTPDQTICDKTFIDAKNDSHSADDWCGNATNCLYGGGPICESKEYKFYDDSDKKEYRFRCYCGGFLGDYCLCDRKKASWQPCDIGGNWTCDSKGCTGGKCEMICKCPDGTLCDECKAGSPPSYCNEATKTLINNCWRCGCPSGENCQPDGKTCLTGSPCQCSDGTPCNQCKAGDPPVYCEGPDASPTINKCSYCGCLTGQTCQTDGSCQTTGGFGGVGGGGVGGGGIGGLIKIENPLEAKSLIELIDILVNIIFTLAVIVAPLMIIIAGFYFVTAVGNPKQIDTAKQIILWTLIGLLVVICAKGIITLFRTAFGI